MRLTIDVDAILARVRARRDRDATLRAAGVAILREWRHRMTAPINQRALQWNAPRPPGREATAGELLREFLREVDHARFRIELRTEHAFDVQVFKNEEFLYSYRFPTRDAATAFATSEQTRLLTRT